MTKIETMSLEVLHHLLLQTLTMLTNAYAVRGRPTLKDVSERFWTGPFRELKAIKEKSKQTMKSNEQNMSKSWLEMANK